MHWFIVFPFYLKYLPNAEYMIRSRPVASESTLMIPPERPIFHSQMSVACPSPETARSSQWPTSHLLKFHLNITHPSTPGSFKWSLSFTQVSPTKPCLCLSSHPYALHAPPEFSHSILGEEYRTLSSCGFLHSPVTSSLLGTNTIQPIPYRTVSHWQMSRNFKSK